VATSIASRKGYFVKKKQVDKVVKEYKDILSSPMRVPLHFQVKHLIDMTPNVPLPNESIHDHSISKNEEIKW